MAKNQSTPPVNVNLESPLTTDCVLIKNKNFWKKTLEYKDLLYMYTRKGIVYRVINKENDLMFKKPVKIDDEFADSIRHDLDFDSYLKVARKYAEVGGFSLIYLDYGDISTDDSYNIQAPTNKVPEELYVISRGWVWEDIYHNQEQRTYYTLVRANGQTIKVHESRIMRVRLNDEEISRIEPAYDSCQVMDNVMWGMGQSMFRAGTGFPVLKIKGGSEKIKVGNVQTTKIKEAKNSGIMNDFNSETGFIIDSEDELKFEGAAGKALDPTSYYDKTFQQVAVDLGLPVDILRGVASGAVTGSETNLREFYSDLKAKQISQIQPLYNQLFLYWDIELEDEQYIWEPIWELSKKEISDNLKTDIDILNTSLSSGFISKEYAIEYLNSNYPQMCFEDNEVEVKENIMLNPSQTTSNVGGDTNSLNKNLVSSHVRFQYGMSDSKVKDALDIADKEQSALPKSIQKLEKGLRKEMTKVYSDMSKEILEVSKRLN